ncbi:hypothetical protein [Nonomuraea rubra]|uniref:hypothetical protein n=1 Tax=Nonomuraea rubra TaxID=46180 RepID=UPI003403CABB
MKIDNLPDTPTREDLETHIVEGCPAVCGGDPQVLADLDVATDEELMTYITAMHEWEHSHATR